jgi:hypothetical protein
MLEDIKLTKMENKFLSKWILNTTNKNKRVFFKKLQPIIDEQKTKDLPKVIIYQIIWDTYKKVNDTETNKEFAKDVREYYFETLEKEELLDHLENTKKRKADNGFFNDGKTINDLVKTIKNNEGVSNQLFKTIINNKNFDIQADYVIDMYFRGSKEIVKMLIDKEIVKYKGYEIINDDRLNTEDKNIHLEALYNELNKKGGLMKETLYRVSYRKNKSLLVDI